MTENNWKYTEVSRKKGRTLKGCIEQTITYVKVDLVNQIRDVGKAAAHGLNLTKSRPKEKTRDSDGKYVKLQPGEFTLQKASVIACIIVFC